MFCPSCKIKNPSFGKFCYNCGHRLEAQNKDNLALEPKDEVDTHIEGPIEDLHIIDQNIHGNLEFQPTEDDHGESIDPLHEEIHEDKLSHDDFGDMDIFNMEAREDGYGDIFDETPDDYEDPVGETSKDDYEDFLVGAPSDDYENLFDLTYDDTDQHSGIFDPDDPFTYDPQKDQEFSSQMPLRRYQKDKSSRSKKTALRTVFSLISIILGMLIIGLLIHRLGKGTSNSLSLSQSITVSSSVEEIPGDEGKTYRIVFNTSNGQEIEFLDDVVTVVNGRAEFLIDENTLYLHNPQPTEDDTYEVILDAVITAPNLPYATESVTITLSPPYSYAPFTLIQPSTGETEFQGSGSKVSFQIQPGSTVIINDEDFSDLVDEDGIFENKFSPPSHEDLLVLDIRVSTSGYLDNIQQIIIRKPTMDVPLEITGDGPISSDEEWIEISGKTDPNALLEADLDIFEEPKIDKETGEFSLYVKASKPGYTPCQLKAYLDDKESTLEVILDRNIGVDSYTSTAWEPEYDTLKSDENLHNGQHFVLTGVINEILETGDKNLFILGLQDNPEVNPVHIEFWGSFDHEVGDRLRIFANRWGAKDGIPRFLAKYIYQ